MEYPPALSLIVLQCADLNAAKDFYTLLGLTFIEEQHGNGPRHYSAQIGAVVFELYPATKPATPIRLGFRVASIDETMKMMRTSGVRIIREATDSPWGRCAVVEDPDGNRVELASEHRRLDPLMI